MYCPNTSNVLPSVQSPFSGRIGTSDSFPPMASDFPCGMMPSFAKAEREGPRRLLAWHRLCGTCFVARRLIKTSGATAEKEKHKEHRNWNADQPEEHPTQFSGEKTVTSLWFFHHRRSRRVYATGFSWENGQLAGCIVADCRTRRVDCAPWCNQPKTGARLTK